MNFHFWGGSPAIRTARSLTLLLTLVFLGSAQTTKDQVAQYEASGDLTSAKALLSREAEANAGDAAAQRALTEFLCRHGVAGCRAATAKWASLESDPNRKKLAQRQLLLLDYMSDQDNAVDLQQYQAAGGNDVSSPGKRQQASYAMVTVPGPLASFARMAALSPDLAPEELLPAFGSQHCYERL